MRAIFSTIKLFIFGLWSFVSIVVGGLLHLFRVKHGMQWVAKYFWPPVVLPLLQSRVTIHGLGHIKTGQSYLIMANHNSFIDIPVLFKSIPFYTYFIAKKELKKIPLLGWYIKASGMIFIDRQDKTKSIESIAQAGKLVENGKSVIIFPEGTKSKDGKIAPFKKGGFHLAEQAGVPILPVKIEGARKVWPNKKPFQLGRGKIEVKIGVPVEAKELEEKTIGERAIYLRELILGL